MRRYVSDEEEDYDDEDDDEEGEEEEFDEEGEPAAEADASGKSQTPVTFFFFAACPIINSLCDPHHSQGPSREEGKDVTRSCRGRGRGGASRRRPC